MWLIISEYSFLKVFYHFVSAPFWVFSQLAFRATLKFLESEEYNIKFD